MAGNRRTKRSKQSGVAETPAVLLFIETSREFGRGLLYGIARYSRLHGPWRVNRQAAGLDSSLPEWKDLKIDGAIVRDVKMAESLAHAGFPVIFAQHSKESYAPFPAIITDSSAIGHMAADAMVASRSQRTGPNHKPANTRTITPTTMQQQRTTLGNPRSPVAIRSASPPRGSVPPLESRSVPGSVGIFYAP